MEFERVSESSNAADTLSLSSPDKREEHAMRWDKFETKGNVKDRKVPVHPRVTTNEA